MAIGKVYFCALQIAFVVLYRTLVLSYHLLLVIELLFRDGVSAVRGFVAFQVDSGFAQ